MEPFFAPDIQEIKEIRPNPKLSSSFAEVFNSKNIEQIQLPDIQVSEEKRFSNDNVTLSNQSTHISLKISLSAEKKSNELNNLFMPHCKLITLSKCDDISKFKSLEGINILPDNFDKTEKIFEDSENAQEKHSNFVKKIDQKDVLPYNIEPLLKKLTPTQPNKSCIISSTLKSPKKTNMLLSFDLTDKTNIVNFDISSYSSGSVNSITKNLFSKTLGSNLKHIYFENYLAKYDYLISCLTKNLLDIDVYEDEYMQWGTYSPDTLSIFKALDSIFSYSDNSSTLTNEITDLILIHEKLEKINIHLKELDKLLKIAELTRNCLPKRMGLKSLLLKILKDLIPTYCQQDFTRFSLLHTYKLRYEFLNETKNKYRYEKSIKILSSEDNSISWLKLDEMSVGVSKLLNFVIVLNDVDDLNIKVKENLRLKIEQYEYLNILLNSLFIEFSRILIQASNLYFNCGYNQNFNLATQHVLIKTNIDTIFQLIDITNILKNNEILNTLKDFYLLMTTSMNNNLIVTFFSNRTSFLIERYLNKIENTSESCRSIDLDLIDDEWGKYSFSMQLLEEFNVINRNLRKKNLINEEKFSTPFKVNSSDSLKSSSHKKSNFVEIAKGFVNQWHLNSHLMKEKFYDFKNQIKGRHQTTQDSQSSVDGSNNSAKDIVVIAYKKF